MSPRRLARSLAIASSVILPSLARGDGYSPEEALARIVDELRLPHPLPQSLERFLSPVENLNEANLEVLEGAHRLLEGLVEGAGFLFAVAVKRTTRSDRLYQPLFEANILKYLIEFVLRGAAFRFHAHLNSFEGADVSGA